MPETKTADATSEETQVDTETTETESSEETAEGQEDLGDAGKKALDAMKAERNAAKADARKNAAELQKLRDELALKDKPAEEQALEKARADAIAEVTKAANARVLKSALKAEATGKLADPTDAHLYINLDDFDVNDDGDVDSGALGEAIANLLKAKPHLAAANQSRFQGGGDGGAKPPAKPTASLDEQISAAHAAGDWKSELRLQNQKMPNKSA